MHGHTVVPQAVEQCLVWQLAMLANVALTAQRWIDATLYQHVVYMLPALQTANCSWLGTSLFDCAAGAATSTSVLDHFTPFSALAPPLTADNMGPEQDATHKIARVAVGHRVWFARCWGCSSPPHMPGVGGALAHPTCAACCDILIVTMLVVRRLVPAILQSGSMGTCPIHVFRATLPNMGTHRQRRDAATRDRARARAAACWARPGRRW